MLKGLQALLASGLLLDPMVLLGIVTGSAFYFGLNSEQITAIYFDYRFYGLAAVVSVLYNFVWRRLICEAAFRLIIRRRRLIPFSLF